MSNLIFNIPEDADVSIVAEQDLGITVNLKKDETGNKKVEAIVSKEDGNVVKTKPDGLFSALELKPVEVTHTEEGYEVQQEPVTFEMVINGESTGIRVNGYREKLVPATALVNLSSFEFLRLRSGEEFYVFYDNQSSAQLFTLGKAKVVEILKQALPQLSEVSDELAAAGHIKANMADSVIILKSPSDLADISIDGLVPQGGDKGNRVFAYRQQLAGATDVGGDVDLSVAFFQTPNSEEGFTVTDKPTDGANYVMKFNIANGDFVAGVGYNNYYSPRDAGTVFTYTWQKVETVSGDI